MAEHPLMGAEKVEVVREVIARPEHVTPELMQKCLEMVQRVHATWKGDPEYQKMLDAEMYALRVALALL